jgi:hypothetical protein
MSNERRAYLKILDGRQPSFHVNATSEWTVKTFSDMQNRISHGTTVTVQAARIRYQLSAYTNICCHVMLLLSTLVNRAGLMRLGVNRRIPRLGDSAEKFETPKETAMNRLDNLKPRKTPPWYFPL